MIAIVVGLGSMGKRRIRLLLENFPELTVIGIDRDSERCKDVGSKFNIKTMAVLQDAFSIEKIDYAFICTSPLSHAEIIFSCLENDINVFTELNLVSNVYQKNISLAEKKKLILFLSSTLLYRTEINFIMEKVVQSGNKLCYTYHVGQYLPDWHPWEKISDFFVSNKKTNGCRELFAIELPWLIKAFGTIQNIHVVKDSISSLHLDYPDIYFVIIEHESGHIGHLCIDVVTRIPIRHLEIFGENLQIEWRGTPESLYISNDDFKKMQAIKPTEIINRTESYREFVVENAYLEEIKEFFAVCNGKEKYRYTFWDDLYTLDIIDKMEQ
jgi:predicted dehydrogenase